MASAYDYRNFIAIVFAPGSAITASYAFCIGVYALIITVSLLARPAAAVPAEREQDTSRVNIEMVPGTTLEQTEAVADRVVAVLEKAAAKSSASCESVREGNATALHRAATQTRVTRRASSSNAA